MGINRIVMAADDIPDKWKESFEKSSAMFKEALVDVDFIRENNH